MIGYPSRQDGAILPARDYPPRPTRKFSQKPYNKSFIDQVCSVKMAGYWPRSFFASLWTLDSVSVHKHAKKELGQYPAILTSHLVNNPYVFESVIKTVLVPRHNDCAVLVSAAHCIILHIVVSCCFNGSVNSTE